MIGQGRNSKMHVKRAEYPPLELRGTSLVRAKLDRANLSFANFTGADLSYATAVGADFTGTILKMAILDGMDLTKAVNLTLEQLESAKSYEGAKLPDYLASVVGQ